MPRQGSLYLGPAHSKGIPPPPYSASINIGLVAPARARLAHAFGAAFYFFREHGSAHALDVGMNVARDSAVAPMQQQGFRQPRAIGDSAYPHRGAETWRL